MYQPKNFEELKKTALSAAKHGKAYFLAGGTDLMVYHKEGLIRDEKPIFTDISRVSELKFIAEEDGFVKIGSGVTFAEVIKNPVIKKYFPALYQAAENMGSPQIRNMATLGGNAATSSPSGDSLPAFYVYETVIEAMGENGNNFYTPVERFFTGPKKNILKNGEFIIAFRLKKALGAGSGFVKIGPRLALAISKVSVAARVPVLSGVVKNSRVAVGACAPTVVLAEKTASFLEGKKLSEEVIEEAGIILKSEISPIDDIRSTGDYRRKAAVTIFKRLVSEWN